MTELPPVAILCGGLGTRLGDLTKETPKSLIKVAGRPFIDHQLRLLAKQGVEKVVLCTGHLAEPIQDYVASQHYGLVVQYSCEGNEPMGTAFALRCAMPLLGDTFLVLYGDSYLTFSPYIVYHDWYVSGRPALLTVFRSEAPNATLLGERIWRYDNRQRRPGMHHQDYGLSVMTEVALDASTSRSLTDVYYTLAAHGWLSGLEVTRPPYEIGSLEGLEVTERYLNANAL